MSALRQRDFRLLFLGQTPSIIGDKLVLVALALYVTKLTASATDLGMVLAAQALPLVSLILFGGVLADRLPRHLVMMACDLIRGLLHALLAALILLGRPQVWEMAAIEALYGAATAFFQPAYTGLLPATVPEELISEARTLTESAGSLARLAGPALATVLVLGVGAGEAFAVDSGSFLFSAAMLVRIVPRVRGTAAVIPAPLEGLREGWREVRSRAWVWATIAAFTGALFFLMAQWTALAPLLARRLYGDLAVYGWLQTLAGVGAVIGGLAAFRWRPRRPLATGLTLILSWPVATGSYALGAPLGLVVPLVVAANFSFAICLIWWEVSLAHHIPPHALSRVSAWDWMGSLALLPLGYALAGPMAAALGARWVLLGGSVIALGLLAAALLPRETRELGPFPPGALAVEAQPPSISRAMSR